MAEEKTNIYIKKSFLQPYICIKDRQNNVNT